MLLISEQGSNNVSKRIRIFDPALRIASDAGSRAISLERIETSGAAEDPLFAQASALFLHIADLNLASARRMQRAFALAHAHGVPVIVDADDDYFSDADCGAFDRQLAEHVPVMRQLLPQAQCLTATGPELAASLRAFGVEVVIIPNCADPRDYAPRPKASSRLRIGFCGGPTHLHDLTAMLPAIAHLQRQQDFEFVLFGLYDREFSATVEKARALTAAQATDPSIRDFAAFAHALKGIDFKHVPSVPYPEFPAALGELDLDIGLCPLLDSHFNRCRSALKFYQYAAVDTVTLASDVRPYQGECITLAKNTVEAWVEKLGALIQDPSLRASQLAQQQTYWRGARTWTAVEPLYRQLLLRHLPASVQHAGG